MALYDVPFYWFTGFETGRATSTLLDGLDASWASSAGISAHADAAKDGLYGLKCAPVAQQAYLGSGSYGSSVGEFTTQLVGTFDARVITPIAGATPTEIAVGNVITGGGDAVLRYNPTTGTLEALFEGGTVQEGPEVVVGEWFHVDVRISLEYDNPTDTLTKTLEWQVDGVAQPDASQVVVIVSNPWVQALVVGPGWNGANTCEVHFDNFGVGFETDPQYSPALPINQANQYPYGPIVVSRLLPAGMGTHDNPTHFTEEDASAIDANTWNKLDEWPPDTSAGVRQITIGAGTSYVEIEFEPTDIPDDRILAVRPCGVITRPSGTGSARQGMKGIAGAHTDWLYANGTSRSTGLMLCGSGQGFGVAAEFVDTWTQALVNDFRLRYGFADDVTPNVQLDAVLLEVAATPPPPPVFGATDSSAVTGRPAHVVIGRSGEAVFPNVADFIGRETASGGQISLTGRVPEGLVRSHPECFEDGATWLVPMRENGEIITAGEIARPALNGGAVDLSASGAERHARREVDHMFWADFGFDQWVQDEAEPHKRGRRPERAPVAALGGAGNVNVGVHRYKVTFVSAEGETRPGPRVEIDVTASAKQVELSRIPTGPGWVTSRVIYRTEAGGSTYKLVGTIGNNTATTFTDNVADASLGIEPPTEWRAEQIDVDVKQGQIVFSVEEGASVFSGQSKGVIRALPGSEFFSAVELEIDPSRDAAGWQLRVETADDEDAALALEEGISLEDDGPSEPVVDLAGTKRVVRIALKRTGADVTNSPALKVRVHKANVYGRAKDADYSPSDVVRDICRHVGVSDRYVKEAGTSAMPFQIVGGVPAEGLDLMALYEGYVWLFYREGLRDVCYFGPPGRRRWIFQAQWGVPDLLPRRPFSRVVLEHRWADGVTIGTVEAIADPNPLGIIRTAPTLKLEAPSSQEFAQTVAQRLADEAVRESRQGTLTIAKIRDTDGTMYPGHDVHAGDAVYVPAERVWVHVQQLEHLDGGIVRAQVGDLGVSILETYNARRERRMAAR